MLSDMIIMRDQDIAKIANRLQVPIIISDILNGEGILTDDVQLGLHEILSDDQPDSALLSIALSARALAENFHGKAAIFTMLTQECDRIIAEYGMMWLRNAQAKKLDDNTVFETLVHIPEDLEATKETYNEKLETLKTKYPNYSKEYSTSLYSTANLYGDIESR